MLPDPSLSEIRSLRDRLRSLENRLQAFERTVLWMFSDILAGLPLPSQPPQPAMLQTPDAIIQALRDRHPDLANHPTLWRELKALLVDDRQNLNSLLQHDMGNAVAAIRQHLESVLHPLEPEDGDPQNPPH